MLAVDKSWTLFLDRDGVINELVEKGYVQTFDEMIFISGTFEALKKAATIFGRIVIVTTQRGVAQKQMTLDELNLIHDKFLQKVNIEGGRIDKIYQCLDTWDSGSLYRKPEIGMALHAKEDFPEIDFSKSVMVGDFLADMNFGRKAGMPNIFVAEKSTLEENNHHLVDDFHLNLSGFISELQ